MAFADRSATAGERPKVYAWCNSGGGTDWQHWIAMAEDGEVLAQHISSTRWFGVHDVGPAMKAKAYVAKFGGHDEGVHYDLVVCDEGTGPPDEVAKRNEALREAAQAEPLAGGANQESTPSRGD